MRIEVLATSLKADLSMTELTTVSPLRQRMIEVMVARKLGPHSQRSHIYSCKRFAAFLKRSPDTATADDVRLFQLHLIESGASICNRNRIMTGVKFLLKVVLRRHDLAAEIYHIKEPLKLPLIMSPHEAKRLLAMAGNIKVRVLLALCYGCGLRGGEAVRLRAGDIDSAQGIIRIVQAKGRKDRHVMLPPEVLDLLRQYWQERTRKYDSGVPAQERWLFPGRRKGLHLTPRQLSRLFHETTDAAGIAYNSCRNRHCPKCLGAAARDWMEAREAELLPVPYFHVVYTLPSQLRDIAYQNKRVVYDPLMKASADTALTIAADPRHLGAKIGITAVLPTWGSASCRRRASGTMTHHPHVHMIVPGGGISDDGARWISSSKTARDKDFFVHVNVLRRLFRGKFLALLADAHATGRLQFFNAHAGLTDKRTFKRFLAPLRRIDWVVYRKVPFGGPEQVLRYLSRYTHRVAISNRRLVAADDGGVSFRWKDYRIEGPERWKTMTLAAGEFIRRFLIHVLPKRLHRIRHYGLFANGSRVANLARARELPGVQALAAEVTPEPVATPEPEQPTALPRPCPCCGGRMIVIEVFARGCTPRHRATPKPPLIKIDTS